MKKRSDIAVEKFLTDYNCAQSVLFSFCDELGFDPDTALKLATGFGAGMGRKQEVCGAVAGGILVIGLKHGRGSAGGSEATEITYRLVRLLMERFAEKHGSCICRVLLERCDLMTAEGKAGFKERDLLNTACRECVRSAVQILENIL